MEFTRILLVILIISFTVFFPSAHAEPTVSIIMEKTTYQYCEKLFYIIQVSEVTGDPAIIHIRDDLGKGSSAIPIPITDLQNPIPAAFAFEREQFVSGKYFIDLEYSGVETTAEFSLIDSDNICIPSLMNQFLIGWLNGEIPDGYLMDAIQKYVDEKLISIPFEINEQNILEIQIPEWVKNLGYWWVSGVISDSDFSAAMSYLTDRNIIGIPSNTEDGI